MPRVTEETKIATRGRILSAARKLFSRNGFDETTTRDLAEAAGIAAGTLFNYFPTKEAVAATIVQDGLEQARQDFEGCRRSHASLEEELFAFVTAGLRALRPQRRFLRPVLEYAFNALGAGAGQDSFHSIRRDQLEAVERLIAAHGLRNDSLVVPQIYWTLYTGVLAFWIDDASRNQEDTLALLDPSLAMFVSWLASQNEAETPKES